MTNPNRLDGPRRREFLHLLGAGVLGVALPGGRLLYAQGAGGKPLRGIFPIAQSPFTGEDALDLDDLVKELQFIHRGGVHGFVWPQMASEWNTLSDKERTEGNQAIAAAGRKLKPAIVLGVQSPDVATSIKYAQQAEKLGADAIISLPPSESSDAKTIFDYYVAVGKSVNLPLFVQAVGAMSVELLVDIHKAIPNMSYVKDEAGNPLRRIGPLREESHDELKVFTGAHGRTLIQEMRLGSSGDMPAASFADLYAQTWDLWQAGKHKEAILMHGHTLAILTEMTQHGTEGMKYILYLRGVFKTWGARRGRERGFEGAAAIAAGGRGAPQGIDEAGKQALKETLDAVKAVLAGVSADRRGRPPAHRREQAAASVC